MNNQKPEPRRKVVDETIDLHSVFFTIQGEGPFAGHRSIFVRLAGCNLQCPGCDTEYTEGRETWITRHVAHHVNVMAQANNAHGCLVVITGGEPFRQYLGQLCNDLLNWGEASHIQIESNGVFEPDEYTQQLILGGEVSLVISPKTKHIHRKAAELATCFKYVLDHRSVSPDDGLPILALEHPAQGGVARPVAGKPVYINPFDAKDEEVNRRNLIAAAESAKRHGYILGVQLHKLVGLE